MINCQLSIVINKQTGTQLIYKLEKVIIWIIYKKLMGNTGSKQQTESYCEQQQACLYMQYPSDLFKTLTKQQSALYRHQLIGSIVYKDQEDKLQIRGVGLLVSPNLVITTASNILDKQLGGLFPHPNKENYVNLNSSFKSLKFCPAIREQVSYESGYEIEAWRFPYEYFFSSYPTTMFKNYAILKLSNKIEKPHNIFPNPAACCKTCLMQYMKFKDFMFLGPIHNIGRLQIQKDQQPLSLAKSISHIKILNQKYQIFSFENFVEKGSDGSVLFWKKQFIGFIFGVNDDYFTSVGQLFTCEMLKRLQQWGNEINGEPFKIKQNNLCQHAKILKQSYQSANQHHKKLKYRQRQKQSNLQHLSKAIQICPLHQDSYLKRGEIYKQVRRQIQAIKDFEKLIQIDPSNDVAFSYLGRIYEQLQDYENARIIYDRIIKLLPTVKQYYFLRAQACRKLKKNGSVLQDYNKAIKLSPSYNQAIQKRGQYYLETGNYQNAIKDFTKIIEISPQQANAFIKRAQAYEHLKEYRNAIQDYSKLIQKYPYYSKYYKSRGNVYFVLQEYQKAMRDYNRAQQSNYQDSSLHLKKSQVILLIKKQILALIEIEKALSLSPNNPLYLIKISICFYELKEKQKFSESMNKCNQIMTTWNIDKLMKDYELTESDIIFIRAELQRYKSILNPVETNEIN